MVLHYLVWEPSYNKNVDDEKDAKFDRSEWINEKCNLYFSYIKRRETNNIEELADPAIEKWKIDDMIAILTLFFLTIIQFNQKKFKNINQIIYKPLIRQINEVFDK